MCNVDLHQSFKYTDYIIRVVYLSPVLRNKEMKCIMFTLSPAVAVGESPQLSLCCVWKAHDRGPGGAQVTSKDTPSPALRLLNI